MRNSTFKFCMTFAALTLIAVACFYFFTYIGVKIAVSNSGLKPFYQHTISALWLTYALQALFIGVMYLLVAFRPHSVSREVVIIFGLLQLVEAVMLLAFSGSMTAASLLAVTGIFVLVGAIIWPKRFEPEITYRTSAPPAA